MERRAVGGNAEMAVTLAIERAGTDAAVEKMPHAFRVAIPRELYERSALVERARGINASIPASGAVPRCLDVLRKLRPAVDDLAGQGASQIAGALFRQLEGTELREPFVTA